MAVCLWTGEHKTLNSDHKNAIKVNYISECPKKLFNRRFRFAIENSSLMKAVKLMRSDALMEQVLLEKLTVAQLAFTEPKFITVQLGASNRPFSKPLKYRR